jgi:hypothetical protein
MESLRMPKKRGRILLNNLKELIEISRNSPEKGA